MQNETLNVCSKAKPFQEPIKKVSLLLDDGRQVTACSKKEQEVLVSERKNGRVTGLDEVFDAIRAFGAVRWGRRLAY